MAFERYLDVLPVNEYEAVSVMSVEEAAELAVPARNFLANARLSPLDKKAVDELGDMYHLIQRDWSGQKKTNARGPLAEYVRDRWIGSSDEQPPLGFLPASILYFPTSLAIDEHGRAELRPGLRGFWLDGDSRFEAQLSEIERSDDPDYVRRLRERRFAVHIVHGVPPVRAASYFADVNGRGVGINPNLLAMRDELDPFAEIARRVFGELGIELETRQRQVSPSSGKVMTGLQARSMVAAIAHGVAVVGHGARRIPAGNIDEAQLELVAREWLARVFRRFDLAEFRSKTSVLRSAPVLVSLGALGRPFYDGDAKAQQASLAILEDETIDWEAGERWAGIAGKLNPTTGAFSVGGGKEYAYAVFNALTDPENAGYSRIRTAQTAAA